MTGKARQILPYHPFFFDNLFIHTAAARMSRKKQVATEK
jgi:hypothetical protein